MQLKDCAMQSVSGAGIPLGRNSGSKTGTARLAARLLSSPRDGNDDGKRRSRQVGKSSGRRGGSIAMLGSIFIGLVSGWLAGEIVSGEGYGVVGDILLGLVGGVIGGWLFGAFGMHAHHLIGALIVSTIGATALVWGAHLLNGDEQPDLMRIRHWN
jgi:uncharacterized membrane protein YeaQ/YmgE (transglycosylase-associated protein family)